MEDVFELADYAEELLVFQAHKELRRELFYYRHYLSDHVYCFGIGCKELRHKMFAWFKVPYEEIWEMPDRDFFSALDKSLEDPDRRIAVMQVILEMEKREKRISRKLQCLRSLIRTGKCECE